MALSAVINRFFEMWKGYISRAGRVAVVTVETATDGGGGGGCDRSGARYGA